MAEENLLTFPDAPRADLDEALGSLVQLANRMTATQGRLRSLLRANQAVVEHLDLATLLRRIVEAAVELVDAQYGALGVLAPDGRLEQLIQVGLSESEVEALGNLPDGHRGIVGALSDDQRPIRLRHISDDPRSVGVPPGHPPMESFLGVPVRVRDEVYGNLYLANQTSGEFSKEDEQLVIALAATAGSAIDNARLFAETQRRQAWAAASAEVTAALLSAEQGAPLGLLAFRTLTLSDAHLACIVRETEDSTRLVVQIARGDGDETVEGLDFLAAGSVSASVIEGGQPRLVDEVNAAELPRTPDRRDGPTMAIPLVASGRSYGALVVSRTSGGGRFTTADLEMAADFAGRASVAMQLATARADQQRMLLLEDRGRIARDLHDLVIQQLFAAGLELQSVGRELTPGKIANRVDQSVTLLDTAIAQIRTAIFALSNKREDGDPTIRHRVIDMVNELVEALPGTPQVEFTGPVDLVITTGVADDVAAVVREALTNVVRHASADHVSVCLAATDGLITIDVIDDGVGIVDATRQSGLVNMEERALRRGGTLTIDSNSEGTHIRWCVAFDDHLAHGEGA